jgi:hypothetical protein
VNLNQNRNDWLNAADSPFVIRRNADQAELAALQASGQGNSDRAKDLTAELELMTGQQGVKLDHIDPQVVKDLLSQTDSQGKTLAYEATGQNSGYVIIFDVIGNQVDYKILEPFHYVTRYVIGGPGGPGQTYQAEESLVGTPNAAQAATHYKLAYEQQLPIDSDVTQSVEYQRTPDVAQGWIDRWVQSNQIQRSNALIDFGVHLFPLVSAMENFERGKYFEAALDLAGDVSILVGLGAVSTGARCVLAGQRLTKTIKLASTVAMGIDGSLAAINTYRGFSALYSEDPTEQQKAWGYFGDATLRFLGLSLNAIAYLRKRSCFIAGTPVHTETGPKPIEQVRAGERVWAFDPRQQAWVLADVSVTFRRPSFELATLTLDNGDILTGTPEHPFWVIEGHNLAARPAPTHGGDEDWSGVPGRWVDMGEVRWGDVVLTKVGRTARVIGAEHRPAAEPVYNIEVAGRRNYAVGVCGALTHNYPTSEVDAAASHGVPHAPETPPAQTGATVTAEANTRPSVTAIGEEVPVSGSTKPTTKGAKTPFTNFTENTPKELTRKPRLPTGGTWEGEPGNSVWHPGDPNLPPVKYQNQYPVFEPVNGVEVKINMVGRIDKELDYGRANDALGQMLKQDAALRQKFGIDEAFVRQNLLFKNGETNASAVRDLLRERNLTWHHHQDMQTMQLVDRRLHTEFVTVHGSNRCISGTRRGV